MGERAAHFAHRCEFAQTLIPGLRIEAKGKGNEDGQLVAKEVLFDRDSMRVSWENVTRVAPLVARATTLEDKTATLDSRPEQVETSSGAVPQHYNPEATSNGPTRRQGSVLGVERVGFA